jgi:VCBS repeat-containing protein
MEPVPQLRPGEELVYRLTVAGLQAGDHVVRVQVVSAESSAAVTKEESTKVYADE